MRVEFPRSVRFAILQRASQPDGVPRCESCGCQVKAGGFEIDHRVPDAMFTSRSDKKANATTDGGWLLCSGQGDSFCHRQKTAVDRTNISKAERLNLKHTGLYVKTGPKLKSRGFG